MEILFEYLPLTFSASIFLIIWGGVKAYTYRSKQKRIQEPLTPESEKVPWQRRLKEIDEINLEIIVQATLLLAVPATMYAGYISCLYFTKRPGGFFNAMLFGVFIVAYIVYTVFKLLKVVQRRHAIRHDYEGALIVAQELNRLVLSGSRVYHDFAAEESSIDHIVVSNKGVFAIETRTRSSRTTKNGKVGATVEYDGRALYFPNGTDSEMIERAKRKSKWLSTWLSRSVGEDIAVRSIVVLPGWFVKRTASKGIPVVNPKQFDSLFQHIKPISLNVEMISRIAHRLDRKGEDAEPL